MPLGVGQSASQPTYLTDDQGNPLLRVQGPNGLYALPISITQVDDLAFDAVYTRMDAGNASLATLAARGTAANPGYTSGVGTSISVTPTLTVHSGYAANDYVGTSGSPMTVAGAARINAGTFVMAKVLVIDKGANTNAGEVWLFDSQITPPADSAAWAISDADAAHVLDVIPIATFYTSSNNSVGIGSSTRLCKAASLTTSIYAAYVIRAVPGGDYADGDLTFVFSPVQD